MENASNMSIEELMGPRRHEMAVTLPVTVIYSAIFVTGIFGNVCTLLVVLRNRYMQTATNYYLFNLAVADLLMLVIGLPQEVYAFWCAYPYVFGKAFCIARALIGEASTYVSILTITAFTFERYLAICHPLRAQSFSSLSRAVKVILLLWLVAFMAAIPVTLHYDVIYLRRDDGTDIEESATCTMKADRDAIKHTFEAITAVFFAAPMLVISVLYAMIGCALRRSTWRRKGSIQVATTEERRLVDPAFRLEKVVQARRSVTKMLIAVVVAFFVCWAPFHAQRLFSVYKYDEEEGPRSNTEELVLHLLFIVSGILYYVNATINPILYNIMSLKYRRAFRTTLCTPCRRTRRRPIVVQYRCYEPHSLSAPSVHFVHVKTKSVDLYVTRRAVSSQPPSRSDENHSKKPNVSV